MKVSCNLPRYGLMAVVTIRQAMLRNSVCLRPCSGTSSQHRLANVLRFHRLSMPDPSNKQVPPKHGTWLMLLDPSL